MLSKQQSLKMTLLLVIIFTACASPAPTATTAPPSATPLPHTATALPSTATLTATLPPTNPPSPTPTQPPPIEMTTYGGDQDDLGMDILQTEEGGFLILGVTDYQGNPPNRQGDIYLVKTDSDRNMVWEKTYGGDRYEIGVSILPTEDGGYIILAETESFGAGESDFYLLKIDSEGDEVWSQTYGGVGIDAPSEMQPTADGGFILVGFTVSQTDGSMGVYLVKTDAEGNQVWSQTFTGEYSQMGWAAYQTLDGGYFVLGSVSYSQTQGDVFFLKADTDGDEMWTRILEKEGREAGYAMTPTSDGNFIVTGAYDPTGDMTEMDFYLLKVDPEGNELWSTFFGDGDRSDYGMQILETGDGGFLLSGMLSHTHFQGGDSDIHLIKTDGEGSVVWMNTLDTGRFHDAPQSIIPTSDGGYAITGFATVGPGAGGLDGFDAFLIITDTRGNPIAGPTPSLSFVDSGQELGHAASWKVSLGDLDGDGDLDAFVANDIESAVWLNDGDGLFSDSGQQLSSAAAVDLGDLDGDGDLDAITIPFTGGFGKVWLNDGGGVFEDSGQTLTGADGLGVALGDLDGDGDLDIFVAETTDNSVWMNDGQAGFTNSGQRLGRAVTSGVALGDLDGDGDLDALAGGWDEPAKVWINDGAGTFHDRGSDLNSASVHIHGLALGDLDGDGDLDAFMAISGGGPQVVWLNDGTGIFTNRDPDLQTPPAHDVSLRDLDGDGDLDAFLAHRTFSCEANTVWLNDGQGNFTDSGLRLGEGCSLGIAVGDLDGDGDLDAFVANWSLSPNDAYTGNPNLVWLNEIR